MMKEGKLKRPFSVLVSDSESGEYTLPKPEASDGKTVFVVVSLTGVPQEKIDALERCHGGPADEVHVVVATSDPPEFNGVTSVSEVSRPGDLTGLSMKIGEVLSGAHGENVYLYFDDVTCLLQFTELRKAFRFLNTLTGRLHSSNGVGYFGINPGAHDDRTLSTVASLFNDTVGDVGVG